MNRLYFTYPYFEDRRVLAMAEGPWVTFFDRFISNATDASKVLDCAATALILMYLPDLSVLGGVEEFTPKNLPAAVEENGIYFDVETASFRARSESDEREATHLESLRYCEVQAGTMLSLDGLRLRILEMSYGFIPSFQYRVERVYRSHFEPLVATMKQADEVFSSKARKAEFSRLFKSEIFPRLSEHGFAADGRSTRAVRRTDELAVFIDFSYISFGSGSYQVSVIWMGNPNATLDDEDTLGSLEPHFPYHSNLMLDSQNAQVLAYSVQEWLRVFDLYLAETILKYQTIEAVEAWMQRDKDLATDKARLGLPSRSPRHAYTLSFSNRIARH